MKATIDAAGRILLPKALRDALGLTPGSRVDVSAYGSGVQITPAGRTARLRTAADGGLVAESDTTVSDDLLTSLIDEGRR